MKKDVVCGKMVDDNTPIATTYGDRKFSFCSKKCEYDFIGNPLRYVDKSRSVGSTEGSPRVNPKGQELLSQPRSERRSG
jgi:YHS domain-containing protein